MSALFPPSLRSQRQFVGTVDATSDNHRATARSLEQTQGGQRSSQAQIVPMDTPTPFDLIDRVVVLAGAFAAFVLVCIFVAERFAPGWFA